MIAARQVYTCNSAYSVSSVDRPKEIRGKVELSADGSEAEPRFFSSDFHLVYQVWISLLREEIFGRSPEYSSPTFNTIPQTVSKYFTNSDGTK